MVASSSHIATPAWDSGKTFRQDSGLFSRLMKGKVLLYFITCFISLGAFQFGCEQGMMSALIGGSYFQAYFNHPTSAMIGFMIAILELGAFLSSIVAGRLGDAVGRRRTLLFGAIIFTAGGILQAGSLGMVSMIFGRFISGLGVGLLSTIVPIYQSEISPAEHRGQLGCIEFTINILGYSSSIWIDYVCARFTSNMSWRIPLTFQAAGGLVLTLGTLVLPESPRYLLETGQEEEGLQVLLDLSESADNDIARKEFASIKYAVRLSRQQGNSSYTELWRRYRKRLVIAMSSQMFAQLAGINVISYYAPLVFRGAGFSEKTSVFLTGLNSLSYLAASILPWYFIDTWGRRPILLTGAAIMCIALNGTSLCMWASSEKGAFGSGTWEGRWAEYGVICCVVVFNCVFGASWGPIPWLYPPEMFVLQLAITPIQVLMQWQSMPNAFRSKAVSLSTATNWMFNLIIGWETPILNDFISFKLYSLHAFFCAVAFCVVYLFYPETAGIPIENMARVFGDDKEYQLLFKPIPGYVED